MQKYCIKQRILSLRFAVIKLAFTLILALGAAPSPLPSKDVPDKVVIATFSIAGDFVQNVVGKHVMVKIIVPAGSEIHGFQLSPRDVKALNQAVQIIGINPQLEPWLLAWAASAHQEHKVVWLAPAPQTNGPDPHLWTDPREVSRMSRLLRAEWTRNFPDNDSKESYEAWLAEVDRVDAELAKLFADLPASRRSFVSQHPNLGWFAHRYGLRVAGTILTSATAEAADPSAFHFSEILKLIRREKIRVIVTDEGQPGGFAERLAQEAGLAAPLSLTFETLQPKGREGDTWAAMMLRNGRRLHTALLAP